MIHKRLFGMVGVATLALGAGATFGVGAAGADQILLACSASPQKATLNPPLGSGHAKYYKSVSKSTGGGACLVDAGISTENPATDATKPNPFDNQTNGHTSLTALSSSTITSGSFTCNHTDPANDLTYPNVYPGHGKLTTKFAETDAKGKQLQLQAYITLGVDPADPDPYHLVVSGIVAKGVGVGGNVHTVVSLFPDLTSSKNLNLTDCAAATAVGNASLAVMDSTPADGSDPDTTVDPWIVYLPETAPAS